MDERSPEMWKQDQNWKNYALPSTADASYFIENSPVVFNPRLFL